jgi:hypothetical protein
MKARGERKMRGLSWVSFWVVETGVCNCLWLDMKQADAESMGKGKGEGGRDVLQREWSSFDISWRSGCLCGGGSRTRRLRF